MCKIELRRRYKTALTAELETQIRERDSMALKEIKEERENRDEDVEARYDGTLTAGGQVRASDAIR